MPPERGTARWTATLQPAPGPSWALAAEPRFSLTESTGDPAVVFVLPLQGVILEDGSTLIRDGSTHLIYLDSLGSAARIAGRPGEGPGEFRRLSEIVDAPGGSGAWAWDTRSGRLSHFDGSGEYVTSLVPPGRTGAPPVAILPGPTFVTIAEREEATGADLTRRLYALRDSQWTVVREIRGPPEPVSPRVRWNESGITEDPEVPAGNYTLPEGCVPRLHEVVIGNELIVADAASGVIHAFGEDGSVREVYRASQRQSVTREIQDALETSFERLFTVSRLKPPASVRREILRDVWTRLGDRLPAWQRVIADPEGRLWLQRPVCSPYGDGDDLFEVIGIDGRLLGSITIPDGMLLLAVRGDKVLVRRMGELQIQYVEMYRLTTAEQAAERRSALRSSP